jgi:hypothetical protein
MQNNHKRNISEGLRSGDLKNYILEVFTVDQYSSKMGEDRDIVVLGFRVKEKYPALDLVEFIEKGYNFILDADMSAGEEYDGQYQVFVEIERTPALKEQLIDLLNGIKQVTELKNWKFRYQRSPGSVEFNEDTIDKHIPMTREAYDQKLLEIKNIDIKEFFNQGAVDVEVNENNEMTFKRPYAGDLTAKFIAIGKYDLVKETLPGALDLSESSQSQIFFLNKFLGNYDINKVGNKFLIKNNDQAIIIEKDRW